MADNTPEVGASGSGMAEIFDDTELDEANLMTTQETELFQSHPMYRYVKQIGLGVSYIRQTLVSLEIKIDMIKKENDAMRVGLQGFLDKIADTPGPSQSLLADSQVMFDDGMTNGGKPFVSVDWEGSTRKLFLSKATEFKLKGSDCARTRCRLILEELHSIQHLRKVTLSGKRMVTINQRTVCVKGEALDPLTMLCIYQMEIERRSLDTSKPELVKSLRLEINSLVSKILEGYRSTKDEDGIAVKKEKRKADDKDTASDSDEESQNKLKKIKL